METHFNRSKLIGGLVAVFVAAGVPFYFSESTDLPLIGLGLVLMVNSWAFFSMASSWWVRFPVFLALVGLTVFFASSIHDASFSPDFALATVSGMLLVVNTVMYFRKRSGESRTIDANRD